MRCEQQISYNRLEAVEVLPESPELEKAVLGALILEPDQLAGKHGKIDPVGTDEIDPVKTA